MRPAVCVVLLLAAVVGARAADPIASAESYSRQCGGQALVVLRMGRIIHESYANGGAPGRPFPVMSITKNLAALAVLSARAERLLSLDEPVAKTITEWRGQTGRERITIRELLNQTSGLASGYDEIYSRSVRDKNEVAIRLSRVAAPGALFDYAPCNYELLEEILRRKLAARGIDPLAYLETRVLRPLGIEAADWRRDRKGNPFFSAGAKLTARELARIGEFVRTRGRIWIFPVLPASAFDGAFAGSSANSMYGFSFWLNANAARGADPVSIEGTLGEERSPARWSASCLSSVAPPDLVAMVGSGGMRCYMVPSRKLVVVRFGNGSNFSDAEFLRRFFAR